jgi:heme/copper-type cytochrome/quinol oxidase subunit 4
MKPYIIGFILSIVVGVICVLLHVSEFLAGWWSCTTWYATITYNWKIK